MTALGRWAVGPFGRWAVGPSVNNSFPEHISEKYLSDCLQILHTTPLGGLVVPFGVFELWPTSRSEL